MSTKDISRSALEGGRANSNKYERNESHRHERSRLREWVSNVMVDHEEADASAPRPRNKVRKEFTDKLNPCYRWLASKAGKPWDEVYGELTGSFDTRKLSAWHIVNQHMLSEVAGAGTSNDGLSFASWHFQRFYIDDDGILQDKGSWRNRNRDKEPYRGPTMAQVFAKTAGRGVIDYGVSQFWADPGEEGRWVCCDDPKRCRVGRHRVVDRTPEMYTVSDKRSFSSSSHWRIIRSEHFAPYGWRQGRKFSKEEMEWWGSIAKSIKDAIVRLLGG